MPMGESPISMGRIPDFWKKAVLLILAVLIVFHAIWSISTLFALRSIGLLLGRLPLQTSEAPVVAVGEDTVVSSL
jgi:hypothetical protein